MLAAGALFHLSLLPVVVVIDEAQVNTSTGLVSAYDQQINGTFYLFTCVCLHRNTSAVKNTVLSSGPEGEELLCLRDGKKEEKFREICARCLRCTS